MSNTEFIYHNFSLSSDVLDSYIKSTVAERKYLKRNRINDGGYESALTNCIIDAIANDKAKFDPTDTKMVDTVEKLIKECGYGTNGKYSESARIAMQKLCIMRGMNPNEQKLYDHTLGAQLKRGSDKVKSFFGFKKKKEETKKTVAKQPNIKTANNTLSTLLVSVVLVGMTTFLCADKGLEKDIDIKSQKKTENTRAKTTDIIVQNYNITNSKLTHAQKTENTKKTVNNEQLQAINNFCDSSLDILMGAQRRDSLYNKIQNQVDRGIFKIPNGMSVQRIAHAMEMSRIYEGKSIILDALNSNTKLTDAQQQAFESHIDGIGIRGEKLQKRMMQKQKLSNHSKFDKSSYAQQKAHIKNLKQLRQLRGR